MALIFTRIDFWISFILLSLFTLLIAIKLRLRWWPAWPIRSILIFLIVINIFPLAASSVKSDISHREVMIVDLSDSLSEDTRAQILQSTQEWQNQVASRILLIYGDQPYAIYPKEEDLPQVDGRVNNLGDSLVLASDILVNSSGRIILATDGLVPQSANVEQAFQTIINRGQLIDWITLSPAYSQTDGYVGQLWAPRNIWEGMPFSIILPIYTQGQIEDIKFELFVNGKNVETTPVLGNTFAEFLIPPQEIGIVTIAATADIPGDLNNDNNSAYLTVRVHKAPNVLFVSEEEGTSEILELLEGLRTHGISVNQIKPAELPTSINELQAYNVLFLNNFLATNITQEQMLTLQVFVSRMGGGLIFLGGRNSYTMGGYKNSLLEPLLPVNLEPPKRAVRPPTVFVLVLDCSSSMGQKVTGNLIPIDLAREAAMRALEKLQVGDYLGVLVFDDTFTWDVSLAQINTLFDLRSALDNVSRVTAQNGTKMYAALDEALSRTVNLPDSAPATRNLLILSDGVSFDGNLESFSELASTAQSNHINISTIAFGRADEEVMQTMAQLGAGRYYRVQVVGDLPKVMIQESEAIREENIQHGETNLVMSSDNPDHPILTGLQLDQLPQTNSYNALTSKSEAGAEDVLVSANFGDPLLSVWQYGLGRVVAWMLDLGEEWTGNWPSPDIRETFWSQVVLYALPQPDIGPENVEITVGDNNVTIDATIMNDITPEADHYFNLSEVKFSYAEESSEVNTFLMPQIAPGRYELEIPRPKPGAYRAALEYISAMGDNQIVPVLFEVNTPKEWIPPQEENNLVNIDSYITQTGGGKISIDSILSITDKVKNEPFQTEETNTGWRWYILLSVIILWPVEIILRRRWLPWM